MEKRNIDILTGLYNRSGLYENFGDFVNGDIFSLLFMDLDNFKTVNDVYGHSEGDNLLSVIGEIINIVAEDALKVRLGGDEFLIIIKGRKTREELIDFSEKLFDAIRMKKNYSPGFSVISSSIGIVLNATVDEDINKLLNKADVALYSAKSRGKACYVFYNDMEEKITKENNISRMAGEAVEKQHFKIKFHPIMHMQTSKIVRIDAYAIWYLDDNSILLSKDYRPVFERTGFIKKFDMYIFELICREIQQIKREIKKIPRVSVVFSRITLLNPELPDNMLDIMDRYEVTVNDIEISVEESIFGIRGNERIVEAMNILDSKGFCMSVTKFGKDFSCVKYLKALPIESIRFDSKFLDDNYDDIKGRQTIKTFVRMGKEYNLLVIGYGVDSNEKIKFLDGCGCDAMSDAYNTNQFEIDELIPYLKEHCNLEEEITSFKFNGNLTTTNGKYTGEIRGEGIEFGKGINNEWGAVIFHGGEINENVISLPKEIFYENSYTISMWIKPECPQILTSAIYMRYMGGFASVMPYRRNNVTSTFRIHEDSDVSVWHDASTRSVKPGTWNHLVVSYDSYNETMRYYINGRKGSTYTGAPVLVNCREVILGGDPFQESFKGAISGLIIYDGVKSDNEVRKLYESFKNVEGFCGVSEKFWLENEE